MMKWIVFTSTPKHRKASTSIWIYEGGVYGELGIGPLYIFENFSVLPMFNISEGTDKPAVGQIGIYGFKCT